MLASISVTTYNRMEMSRLCLDTIHERTPRDEYELIVVDNGSMDGTVEMLKSYKEEGVIDKLILNHPNSLGKAINDAWKLSSPKAEWLIPLSNDVFCMKEWFDNFKLLVESEFRPEYMFSAFRMPGFKSMLLQKTTNGGSYVTKTKWELGYPFGGGFTVRKDVALKHKLLFNERPFTHHRSSIYSVISRRAYRLKLRFVAMGKPCILMQDCDFANPKYQAYYKKRFGIDKKDSDQARRLRKLNRLQQMGYTTNPYEYYEGSDYLLSPLYAKSLEGIKK
jgi:glycosyltransferase involved in cell wall biosynthesis